MPLPDSNLLICPCPLTDQTDSLFFQLNTVKAEMSKPLQLFETEINSKPWQDHS